MYKTYMNVFLKHSFFCLCVCVIIFVCFSCTMMRLYCYVQGRNLDSKYNAKQVLRYMAILFTCTVTVVIHIWKPLLIHVYRYLFSYVHEIFYLNTRNCLNIVGFFQMIKRYEIWYGYSGLIYRYLLLRFFVTVESLDFLVAQFSCNLWVLLIRKLTSSKNK